MILGRSLDTLKLAARAKLVEHFTSRQDAARPASLQVIDALKLAEAKTVIGQGHSDYLTEEANLRGVSPLALAQEIKRISDATTLATELKRQVLNRAVDACSTHGEIAAVLMREGVEWPR